MPAFGLSQAGKNARGQINQLPFDLQELMKRAMGSAQWQGDRSASLLDPYFAYNRDILDRPNESAIADPTRVRAYGEEIMPGVKEAIARIMDQVGKVQNTADNIPSRQYVTDAMGENIENLNKASFNLADFNRSTTDNMFNGIQGLSDTAFSDMGRNIDDTYGKAEGDAKGAYGAARSQLGGAFDEAKGNLENLLPAGDLAAARSARAFAPAKNAAMRRLRAAGIDPNSPEAAGILQAVEIGRARSSDDILSQNLDKYVSGKNSLTLGKAEGDNALALQANEILRNLGLGKGALTRENTANQLTANTGIVEGRGRGQMQNENDFYGRHSDIANLRNTLVQNERTMGLQDIDVQSSMYDLIQDAVSKGIDLNSAQFQTAFQNLVTGQNQKNQAAQNLGNGGQDAINNSLAFGNQAGNMASTAFPMFEKSLANESANSNWAGKLLTGVAGAALNMFAPGMGNALTGALSGVNSGGANGQPYSGAQTPPFQNPQNAGGPQGQQGNMFSGMTDVLKKAFGRNKSSVTSQQLAPVTSTPTYGQQGSPYNYVRMLPSR